MPDRRLHDSIRRDVNRAGKHVLLYAADGTPQVWADDGALYQRGHATTACDVWALVDHAEECGLTLAVESDVIGLLRAAAADCDEAAGETCGCGLLYGKYPLAAGHDGWTR